MQLWDSITEWLHKPFKMPLDPVNLGLAVVIVLTVAAAWSQVLNRVLEE